MKHLLAYFLLVFMDTSISHACSCPSSCSGLFAQFDGGNSSTYPFQMATILPLSFWENEWIYPVEGLMIGLIIFLTTHYRLMRSEKMLSDEKLGLFLKIIHKTHTPLTLIQNLVGDIAACELPESASGDIKYVAGHVNHVIDRYRNVMLFDKMEERMQPGTPTVEFELFAYITSITDQLRVYARTNQVQLKVSKSPGYIGCRVNEITMTAALQCLVEQMIDATPKNGCVNIAVSHRTDSWCLQISNCPDSKTDRNKLFWQLYALMSVHCCGSLRLVRKIIRLHGGKMIGIGHRRAVTFLVTIPLGYLGEVEGYMAEKDCTNKGIGTIGKKMSLKSDRVSHILLIMADKELSDYLHRALSERFRVSILKDAENISGIFSSDSPEAIIIDETVNGILGDELCSKIKSDASTCNIPVILLIHSNDNESYLAHLRCGADKLEQRMIDICKLKADIQFLIDGRVAQNEYFKKFMTGNGYADLPVVTKRDVEVAQFMEKVHQLLEKNLSEDSYTVKKLVSDLGMCRTKFYNKITEITGSSPQEYIFSFKMDKARMLLLTQQYTVEEIATCLGYCDGKYFGKRFKEFYHVSPTQYVKNAIG